MLMVCGKVIIHKGARAIVSNAARTAWGGWKLRLHSKNRLSYLLKFLSSNLHFASTWAQGLAISSSSWFQSYSKLSLNGLQEGNLSSRAIKSTAIEIIQLEPQILCLVRFFLIICDDHLDFVRYLWIISDDDLSSWWACNNKYLPSRESYC